MENLREKIRDVIREKIVNILKESGKISIDDCYRAADEILALTTKPDAQKCGLCGDNWHRGECRPNPQAEACSCKEPDISPNEFTPPGHYQICGKCKKPYLCDCGAPNRVTDEMEKDVRMGKPIKEPKKEIEPIDFIRQGVLFNKLKRLDDISGFLEGKIDMALDKINEICKFISEKNKS